MTTGALYFEPQLRVLPKLLAWFDRNRRDLPWRRTRDPYSIWVSEIMLQQTRVAVVIERYTAFIERFPTVGSLALAAEADVLALWSGLGYYRRARMLHQAAKVVVAELDGHLPANAGDLRQLPGIGAYTAAAIASIAHGEAVAVVDGNVERVVQRLAGMGSEASDGRAGLDRQIRLFAEAMLDPKRPGDHNQAMMELGATVCLPRNPLCLQCPLVANCKTRGEHPTPTRARMLSQDAAYALVLRGGAGDPEVLLEQRGPAETVMPNMWELPALRAADTRESAHRMTLRHAIMQVNYAVRVFSVAEAEVTASADSSARRRWVPVGELASLPLTGLARKVLERAKLASFGRRVPQ